MVLAEFKLKYAGSALGYVWSVIKPLSLFTIMYLVFGRIFKLDDISPHLRSRTAHRHRPLVVLRGWHEPGDGLDSSIASPCSGGLSFPRVIIPTAATLTAAMTFGINARRRRRVRRLGRDRPAARLAAPPRRCSLELYLFTLGMALILTTLFVSLRDMLQVWELERSAARSTRPRSSTRSPISRPGLRDLAFLFPFTQVMQDVRALVLYDDDSGITVTANEAFGSVRPPAADCHHACGLRVRSCALQAT